MSKFTSPTSFLLASGYQASGDVEPCLTLLLHLGGLEELHEGGSVKLSSSLMLSTTVFSVPGEKPTQDFS